MTPLGDVRRRRLMLFLSPLAVSIAAASPGPRSAGRAQAAAPAAEAPLPDPLAAGWQGDRVCESLHDAPELRVLRCTFPPRGGHERHFHAPHYGYVLAGGRMRITDAGGSREVELEEGADWESDGVQWHEVLNVGETTSAYLIVEPLTPR